VIAEIIPEAYDAIGRRVSRPFDRKHGPQPTFPLGRYAESPLSVSCARVEDVRRFLCGCKSVSDKEQFGKEDYWQPPDQFEKTKQGDCDDFAFWTWRQFLEFGYEARVVFGQAGRYGIGHAWVEFCQDGKWFLVEPQYCVVGPTFPRLSTVRFRPRFSVEWTGHKLAYYAHQKRRFRPRLAEIVPLASEWIMFWSWFWIRCAPKIPRIIWMCVRRFHRRASYADARRSSSS
jgi:hypothetical protein